MQYELACECGEKMLVRETAAGAKEVCRCGRTLIVPSLHELRSMAGLPGPQLQPEKVIETLLLAGKLPEDRYCVRCRDATDGVICCMTECERATVLVGQPRWWMILLGILSFSWVYLILAGVTTREDQEWGQDRIFPLPLRVCPNCRPHLVKSDDLKAALCQVPVYRRLLEKYPDASVTVSSS